METMAGHNYLSDPKNPFFSLEDDVDDETFLRSAPVGTRPVERYHNYDNDLEQKRQQLLQRKREIEERTIQSSERSVSLLRDSEQIGAATAEVIVTIYQVVITLSRTTMYATDRTITGNRYQILYRNTQIPIL